MHGFAQGLYTEMKFERPSRIQATTLPMILQPPYRSMIAQVCAAELSCCCTSWWIVCQPRLHFTPSLHFTRPLAVLAAGTQWQRQNNGFRAVDAQPGGSPSPAAAGSSSRARHGALSKLFACVKPRRVLWCCSAVMPVPLLPMTEERRMPLCRPFASAPLESW